MKKYIKNIAIACVSISSLFMIGCTNSFEEVNKDPDNAENVPTDNLLAYSLYYTSYRCYDRWFAMDEPMSFGGYVAKMSYIDEARYQFRPGVQDTNWEYIYRVLNNVMDIQKRSEASPNMLNVAKVLEVHLIQIATDRWRDVPYSAAVKMAEGTLTPTYDKQEDIYPAMLAKLKEAADGFAEGGDDDISGGDLLFGGDMLKWQKYCNSLRLRLAIRISGVDAALAKSTIEEVLGNAAKYPIMESNDDNAFFMWQGDDSNYYEPIADAYRTRKTEFCCSDVMVNYLLENKDPRISVYCAPTKSSQTPPGVGETESDYTDGTPVYRGYTIGASSNPTASKYSVWGYRYGQDLGGFSPYMRVAEVYFHIAEAAKLGYNTHGMTAEEAYTKGVESSLTENGVSDADVTAYLEGAGKFDGSLKQIWYEEWVAMFKQAMEGWSLYRRTGVPETNYIAPGRANKYANHNVPPFRSPYPNTELSLNGTNNAPFNAEVVDDFWGKQMWWDTRTGVH
ncbi:MAG: SusD/RagB family nutrient-binding outer membrane lipoprotein [Parabacteroides sp.]|nr:SusD/RagB family nutrient-binding outer membrane lipoprotein [Parabacteroides sp.]